MTRDLPAPVGAGAYNVYTGESARTAPCRRQPSWVWSRRASAPSAAAGWWCRFAPTDGGPSVRGTGWWIRPSSRRTDDRCRRRPASRGSPDARAGRHCRGGSAAGGRAGGWSVGVARPADQRRRGADPQRRATPRLPGQRIRSLLRRRVPDARAAQRARRGGGGAGVAVAGASRTGDGRRAVQPAW